MPLDFSESTPVDELKDAAMFPIVEPLLVNANTSSDETKFVIVTVARNSVVLSESETVIPEAMAVA